MRFRVPVIRPVGHAVFDLVRAGHGVLGVAVRVCGVRVRVPVGRADVASGEGSETLPLNEREANPGDVILVDVRHLGSGEKWAGVPRYIATEVLNHGSALGQALLGVRERGSLEAKVRAVAMLRTCGGEVRLDRSGSRERHV